MINIRSFTYIDSTNFDSNDELSKIKEVLYNRCLGLLCLECFLLCYLFIKILIDVFFKRTNQNKQQVKKFAYTYIRTNLIAFSIIMIIFIIRKIVSII